MEWNYPKGGDEKPPSAPLHDPGEEPRQLPQDVQQAVKAFDHLIEMLYRMKEEAFNTTDFEKAAYIRDQEHELLNTRGKFIRLWSKH